MSYKCDICGRENEKKLFNVKDRWYNLADNFHLAKCLGCNQVSLQPMPTKDQIASFYPSEYAPHKTRENSRMEIIWEKYLHLFQADLALLEGEEKGTLLDVGCGSGSYLRKMKKRGWSVRGVEMSSLAADEVKKAGIDVYVGQLEEAEFTSESFDAVTMNNVLEHLLKPKAVLNETKRILRKGGKLVIEVPNIDSLEAKLFRDYWYHIDAPRHIYHFSPKTLRQILEQCGFVIEKISYSPSPVSIIGSLNYVLKKKIEKVIKNSKTRNWLYLLLPISSILASLRTGSTIIVKARKV